jgi:hypothetical protein
VVPVTPDPPRRSGPPSIDSVHASDSPAAEAARAAAEPLNELARTLAAEWRALDVARKELAVAKHQAATEDAAAAAPAAAAPLVQALPAPAAAPLAQATPQRPDANAATPAPARASVPAVAAAAAAAAAPAAGAGLEAGLADRMEEDALPEDGRAERAAHKAQPPNGQAPKRSASPEAPGAAPSSKKKRKERACLTFAAKRGILERISAGDKQSDIARAFNITPATVTGIKKQAAKIMAACQRGLTDRAKESIGAYPVLEAAIFAWLQRAREGQAQVSDKALLDEAVRMRDVMCGGAAQPASEAAEREAKAMRESGFEPTPHWLQRFKKRWLVTLRRPRGVLARRVCGLLTGDVGLCAARQCDAVRCGGM